VIFCGTHGLLKSVPVERVREFEKTYLELLTARHKELLQRLRKGEIDDEIMETLENVAEGVAFGLKD